ncbi:MAG: OmpA family protein [Dysgonamonadaceae bacterium]|nr:OmpA family protein [Dysgonamonadaceae bacterium]MDD4728348.1 OmpA family protein [Dysgonamonadaceae bacterium]
MYQKIKLTLSVIIFIIGASMLNAQSDTIDYRTSDAKQGEIVMTKSDLVSFLEKVANAKKEIMQQELENANIARSYNIISPYSSAGASMPLSSHIPLQNMSRNDLLREVEVLNARLNSLYGYGAGNNSTTILTTPGGTQGAFYPYQTPVISSMPFAASNNNGELRGRIDSLQRQVGLLTTSAKANEKGDEISRLNREIEQAQDSLMASSTLTPDAKEMVKRYGTSQMQVLFENNVTDVSFQYRAEVENVAIILKKNPQLSVVLNGFASSVGNAKYNYDLSMRRNEAVKRMLIDYGVFPDQISSVFYGEDKTSSPSEARRVDIKFIIK